MFSILKQLKNLNQTSLFSKSGQEPLLNKKEILRLFYSSQINKKNLYRKKNDIAFKQIGDIQSIHRGQGMDYEESRRYQPGDDPRYMNWQLSAKTSQYYMKVFREERQPGVFIVIDRRQSMRFGTQQRLKVTQAVRAAAIAAFSAQENNHSVGGVILDSEIQWITESNNKQSSFSFITQAAQPAPTLSEQESEEPSLVKVLSMLNEVITSGSTVYLISDFNDIDISNQSLLLQLSTKHQIHAYQISDPAEHIIPVAGNIILKSATSNEQQHFNTNSPNEQERFKNAAKQYFASKKSLFEDVAISYQIIFTTEENIESKIIL